MIDRLADRLIIDSYVYGRVAPSPSEMSTLVARSFAVRATGLSQLLFYEAVHNLLGSLRGCRQIGEFIHSRTNGCQPLTEQREGGEHRGYSLGTAIVSRLVAPTSRLMPAVGLKKLFPKNLAILLPQRYFQEMKV
jgi:hypothetical protein